MNPIEAIAIVGAVFVGGFLLLMAVGAIAACMLSSKISRIEDANERDRMSLEG